LRTKETAEIISKELGFSNDQIIFDNRLHEVNVGKLDGMKDSEYQAYFGSREEKFWKIPPEGESHSDVKNRMTDFVYETDSKYEGKNILIVSHNTPIWLMFAGVSGMTPAQAIAIRESGQPFVENSEIKEMPFSPIPHNRKYELDLHRPFIDEVELNCTCGGKMKRIPEVFDCWFESGSMPYGQKHYPFENLESFNPEKGIGFPADFIAEGVDQTRGWFYSMLVISTALFGKSSYKNVVVNGIVLAEDGQKMAKRLKNYPDPMELAAQYGADAMRYYLLSSPVMKAEDLAFSAKGVDEVVKKIIMRLQNVFTFYEMYGKETSPKSKVTTPVVIPVETGIPSSNILDKWVLARLKEVATSVTKDTDKYELDRATRPLGDFVDELSTWYIRRSRDRYKSDDVSDRNSAIETTKTVLLAFSKLLAPSMPFLAEDLYLKLGGEKESVHLADWPEEFVGEMKKDELEIIELMTEVRKIVTLGLEARAKAGIKVRQPLKSLKVKSPKLKGKEEYSDLIKDEVNVKGVVFDESITVEVELDTEMTVELKEEGMIRDLIRSIQEMRKEKKLNPEDVVLLSLTSDEKGLALVKKFEKEVKKTAGLKDIDYDGGAEEKEISIEDMRFFLEIK
jgi:isoleucyl-tRNA synthetase